MKSISESYAKIWEEPLVLPTYQVGKPDPNPRFYAARAYQGAQEHVYPYAMLDRLTDIRKDKTYNAVYLENEYVKICVLPEVGGRLFIALDKTNNYDFLYHQHVIKPALIGVLGAWLSGGVEWDFPHHHRPTIFMPIDYTLQENPDGSKTLWVGEIEHRHRMKWTLGLTLYPGKSYFEVTMKLFNRTPFAHSFLYWANVAVHATPEYQIIFPPSTEFATYHTKNQFARWPISHEVYLGVDYTKGVDISWWKNHPAPTSLFAWNYEDDFFASYDHGKDAGAVHIANHHIVPGKKFFQWGPGPEGKIWEKMLTDTDGPYVELMIGAYSDNQPDYSWLQPYEVKIIKQYWYPIRQIGGVKNANLKAAVNLELTQKNTVAKIGLNTTSQHKNAKVLLKAVDKIIFEQKVDISPDKPFSEEILLPAGVKEEDLQVSLLSSTDGELIAYKPVKKKGSPMPPVVKSPELPKDIKTVEELYLIGLRLEQFHNPAVEPYPYYEEALRRDPDNYKVNVALGISYFKRGLFKEAEERFRIALKRAAWNYTSPRDGEACYYLALVLRFQGKNDAAYDIFYKVTWSYAFHTAAHYHLAEIDCMRGDFSTALEHIDRSIVTNAWNTKALNLKAAVLRQLGRFEEAVELASKVLSFDPLDFWAGYELYLAKSEMALEREAQEIMDSLKVKMRDEVQSYLELAIDYSNCGLWDEAIKVLSQLMDSNGKKATTYPMVYYYLGYFWEKKGDNKKASRYCQLGSKMSPEYCFPFRLESIQILQNASKNNPEDACAPYYLGNLLYDHQPKNAIREWEKSGALDDKFATVHRNLGQAYAKVENNLQKAITSMEKAVACDGKDPRLFYELDILYAAAGISPQKRLALLQKNHQIIVEHNDALSREVILLTQLGHYDKAIKFMKTHHFHIWEGLGLGELHTTYVDAYLLKSQKHFKIKEYQKALRDCKAALEYPENLEIGKPYSGGRECEIYYFIGTIHEALGNFKKARLFYEKSVAEKIDYGSKNFYYQGLSFQKLNQRNKAKRIFEGLLKFGKEELETLKAGTFLDFFAKFGVKGSKNEQTAEAHYLSGLGHLGMGKKMMAKKEFEKVLKLNINHIWAKMRLSELK